MSSGADSVLFEPFWLGPYELPGRVFKSATSETRCDEHGFVTDRLLEFYEPVARAKTPLIITGNLYVSRQGCSTHREGGIDDDHKIPGLRDWAQVAHRHGSAIVAQLNPAGRQVGKIADGVDYAVSASDVREPILGQKPRPLSVDGIRQVVISSRVHTVMWPPVRGLDYMRSASASRQSPAARSSRRSSSSRCPVIAPSPGTTWRQPVSPNAIVSSVLVQVMFSACPSTGIDSG
jgi:hypothetical protein